MVYQRALKDGKNWTDKRSTTKQRKETTDTPTTNQDHNEKEARPVRTSDKVVMTIGAILLGTLYIALLVLTFGWVSMLLLGLMGFNVSLVQCVAAVALVAVAGSLLRGLVRGHPQW